MRRKETYIRFKFPLVVDKELFQSILKEYDLTMTDYLSWAIMQVIENPEPAKGVLKAVRKWKGE